MSFWKKAGRFLKKAAPIAAVAAPFIPGLGSLVGGAISKVGNLFGIGGGASQAQPPPPVYATGSEGGVQQLPPMTVTPGFDWSKLSGALGAVGSVASAGASMYGAREQNIASAEQAQKQMDFQERMSSTSYQRSVADMKAAGMNPMLGYSQGGASAPSGASAPVVNETGTGANSALQALTTLQGLENANASADLTRAETARTLASVALVDAQTGQSTASARQADAAASNILAGLGGTESDTRVKTKTEAARVAQARAESRIKEAGVPAAQAEAKFYQSALGENSGFLGSAAKAASVFRSILGR